MALIDQPLDLLLHQASLAFQVFTESDATFSDPVVLKDGPRSLVVRCRVHAPHLTPTSLIIKQFRGEVALGFNEWSSLEFLSRLPVTQSLAPHFYGGDLQNRLILMEDLGAGQSLEEILNHGDANAARAAINALAVQMARLQGSTLHRLEEFESIRAALPASQDRGRRHEADLWLAQIKKVVEWFEALGIEPPRGFSQGVRRVADLYLHPGAFLAFTHGDPAPTNNHFAQAHSRLLDFEYGTYRHALYDITAWYILCPPPLDYALDMTRCFREELAHTCPTARDQTHFDRDFDYLCTYRALAILSWISPNVLEQNLPWASNWTMREAVLVALSRLEVVTASHIELESISQAAGKLQWAVLSRWPKFESRGESIPRWPALE